MNAVENRPSFAIFLDIDGVLNHNRFRPDEELNNYIQSKFGEINHRPNCKLCFKCLKAQAHYFEIKPLSLFHKLIEKIQELANLHIIISSAWRRGLSVEELQELFSEQEFSRYIIDKTNDNELEPFENWNLHCNSLHYDFANPPSELLPRLLRMRESIIWTREEEDLVAPFIKCRGSEIKQWLANHAYDGYVVIDDTDDHLTENFQEKFISTKHPIFNHAIFTKEAAIKAYRLFLNTIGKEELENLDEIFDVKCSLTNETVEFQWKNVC